MYHHHTKTAFMCQPVPIFQCARFSPLIVKQRNRLADTHNISVLLKNTFNVCKSIKNRPCTVLYAILQKTTTRNCNTLLWHFGYNLPNHSKTFSS